MITALLAAACSGSQEQDIRIDPDAVGSDQGTLISIGDLRSTAQIMIDSMNESSRLAALRRDRSPLKVLVGPFKHRTSIAIFDKNLFVNRLLASLGSADKDGAYAFILRDDVREEREQQESGTVETSLTGRMTGADYVLSGEVREILHREPEPGGGEAEKRTIQYALRVTSVADGTLVWTDSHEVVKMQVIGAVYR